MNSGPRHDDPDATTLSLQDASRPFAPALRDSPGGGDDLVERLARADGAAWLERELARVGRGIVPALSAQLLHEKTSLREFQAMFRHGKGLLFAAHDRDTRLAARLLCYLAIAAALVRTNRLLCDRSRDEVERVVADLSGVAPAPWKDLLGQAAGRLEPPD